MKEMHKLKDMLSDELAEYAQKGELSAGSLDVIDKLSHAAKSIATLIAMDESGYSGDRYPGDRYSNERRSRSYNRGSSYARRDSRGRYSRYDGYSGAVNDMIEQLTDMMNEAPDQETREEIQRLVTKFQKLG